MKKTVSMIVLLVLCAGFAWLFYAHASDLIPKEEGTKAPENSTAEATATETDKPSGRETTEKTEPSAPALCAFERSGTFTGMRLSETGLRLEWTVLRNANDENVYVSVEAYLDHPAPGIVTPCDGAIYVGERSFPFTCTPANGKKAGTAACVVACGEGGGLLPLSASMTYEAVSGEVRYHTLDASGAILIPGAEDDLPRRAQLPFKNVPCGADLPTGDEICALCGALRYAGYDVDKNVLCDGYLDKGPVGYTDPTVANIGNPHGTFNSHGCYAPVIAATAEKFFAANGGGSIGDLTSAEPYVLYGEVAAGMPVIVWVSADLNVPVRAAERWSVSGKDVYRMENMACMVLIGYDLDAGTVTLADPAGNLFDADASLFEARYRESGSQSLVILPR